MKKIFKWLLLLALGLSLNSCGLPGAIGRSLGRAVNGLDNMLAPR
jgi:hypothetical protein